MVLIVPRILRWSEIVGETSVVDWGVNVNEAAGWHSKVGKEASNEETVCRDKESTFGCYAGGG